MLAYISTDSASFGTVTEYEVFAALNPVKSYCPFIPRFANVATLDFVCGCCCVFEFEFEFEFEALFEPDGVVLEKKEAVSEEVDVEPDSL